jgi:serine/threonine protein kinase
MHEAEDCGASFVRDGRAPADQEQADRPTGPEAKVARPAKSRVARWLGRCFYACGDEGLPMHIDCQGQRYVLKQVLKHDFVAGTGLYESVHARPGLPRKLVGKMNRRMHFCLIPLGLLGRLVTHSELCNLGRCRDIRGVPKVVARLSSHLYTYEYIEGQSLQEKPPLPAGFFDDVLTVVRAIHARRLVHFDLNKPGNILVGADGRAYIIDFQMSMYVAPRLLLSKRLSARLRQGLQSYDIYHVCKHKRRLQPRLLTEAEERLSRHHTLLLRIHRVIAGPYKRLRRACLRYLHLKGILTPDESAGTHGETDPTRWTGQSRPTKQAKSEEGADSE